MSINLKSSQYLRKRHKLIRLKHARVLLNECGETLVETLISVLIVSAVFLMLCTAIVTAANINSKAADLDPVFNAAEAKKVDDTVEKDRYSLKIDGNSIEFDLYKQNEYLYYSHIQNSDDS